MKHIELFLKIVFYPITFILLFIIAIQVNQYLVEAFKSAYKKPEIEIVQSEQKPELTIPKLVPSNAI